MEGGALNEARRMITPRSREVIEEGKYHQRDAVIPPAAVSLGKERRIPMMSKLGGGGGGGGGGEWDL